MLIVLPGFWAPGTVPDVSRLRVHQQRSRKDRDAGRIRACKIGVITISSLLAWGWPLCSASAADLAAECRPNPHVLRAKAQYERLEFDSAARTLQRAIEYARNCRDDLIQIYQLKGFIDAINTEYERCQRAFEIVLALDPTYRPRRGIPPKVATCFRDALKVAPHRRRLGMSHIPPEKVPPNVPLALNVSIEDPLRLTDRVQLWFRRKGVEIFTTVTQRADQNISLVVPALSLPASQKGYAFEYFIRSIDRWDGTLVEAGSAEKPLLFFVEGRPTGQPFVTKWWFWTAVGAVAVGAAAATFAVTRDNSNEIPLSIIDGGTAGP